MTPSGRDAVQFTRESAERIANVVRAIELAPTPGRAFTFDPQFYDPRRRVVRMATFSGAWAINGEKTVTFRGATTTVSATNLLLDVPSAGTRNCAIAKDGTAWYLVFPQVWTREVTLATGTATQAVVTSVMTATSTFITLMPTATYSLVTGIDITATLNTTDCSISISQQTQGTAVVVLSGAPQSTTATVLTSAPETASIVVQTGTFTATIITLESP